MMSGDFLARSVTGELLAQAAATQPAPREWLARFAGSLVRLGAEKQMLTGPHRAAEHALALRVETSEIIGEAEVSLDRILSEDARQRRARQDEGM